VRQPINVRFISVDYLPDSGVPNSNITHNLWRPVSSTSEHQQTAKTSAPNYPTQKHSGNQSRAWFSFGHFPFRRKIN